MSKSRSYCLTIWDKPPDKLPDGVRYFIYGEEICPKTNKIHYQAYIETFNPQRISFHKKLFGKSVHAEARKGTRLEARDYCMKDGKWHAFGEWISGQGYRGDLEEIANSLIKGTMTLADVMTESPTTYCKYRNGIKDIASFGTKLKTKEYRKVKVIVLSGPTRCGKTREAMKHAKYKIEGSSLQWWQDYNQEKCILIDEYNNDVNIVSMLSLLDGYQKRLQIKGSHTYANWDEVYITTNLTKDEIHPNAKEAHRDAFFARVTEWRDFWDEVPPGNTNTGGDLK